MDINICFNVLSSIVYRPIEGNQPDRDGNGILRPLVEADVHAVVRLIELGMNRCEAQQAAKTLEFHFACKNQNLNDGRNYYVVVVDSAVQGIVGLHHYCWGPSENVWLAWFTVETGRQGEGLGQILFHFVLDRARQWGYRKLFVETYSTQEFASARSFYQKMGMIPAGIVTPYLSEGGNMIVYYKDLTNHA